MNHLWPNPHSVNLLREQQHSVDLPLHTNQPFSLNCITVNGYKSKFLPSGPVLQERPSFYLFFSLENCGPDLRQHAIVKVTNPLYPGNRYRERKSKCLCH